MKLLLYLSYNGADFCGYQAQANGRTVQQTLNLATEALFGYPCDITGCSRTDSGVHARMFCAAVTARGTDLLHTTVPVDRIPRAINIHLPPDVAVWDALWVPSDFHPRYHVSSKEYEYVIHNAPLRDPFSVGRRWHVTFPLNGNALAAMNEAAAHFVGTRDFSSCMAAGSSVRDTVRTVTEATVTRHGEAVIFRVRADGFLYNMVRIMAGTLVDVAMGRIDPQSIPARLDACDRSRMGHTAPPEGLYLNRVFYQSPDVPGYQGGDRCEP